MNSRPGKPGRKPEGKLLPRQPLTTEPPAELKLSRRAKVIYRDIARTVQAEGFASQCDARTVANCAQAGELVERLEQELANLPGLLLPSGKVHPLVAELKNARTQYHSLLGALLLTPRSRSSSRLTEAAARAAAARGAEPSPKLRFFRHTDEGGNHAANHG